MASPRSAPGEPTQLSLFLRSLREERHLTQSALIGLLNLTDRPQYLSKLETGRIARPDDDFLRALARFSKRTVDELVAMTQRPAAATPPGPLDTTDRSLRQPLQPPRHPVGSKIRLAYGHCAWAAPIMAAGLRDQLPPEIELASFRPKATGSATLALPSPIWSSDTLEWKKGLASRREEFDTMSARDAIDLLNNQVVQVAAVPGDIVDSPLLTVIGTVVDSFGGCTMVMPASKAAELRNVGARHTLADGGLGCSTSQLAEWLKLEPNEQRGAVGFEIGTIAQQFFLHAVGFESNFNSESLGWGCDNSQLAKISWSELASDCEQRVSRDLLAFITWEPHATWLTTRSTSVNLEKVPLHFGLQAGRPTHMTFDLVCRKESIRDPSFGRVVSSLLAVLEDQAHKISQFRRNRFDERLVWMLARQFDFSAAESPKLVDAKAKVQVLEALSTIRFRVGMDPFFQKELIESWLTTT